MGLQNIADTERMIRIFLGLVLTLAALLSSGTLSVLLLLLGLLALITGTNGFCLFYLVSGSINGKKH